MNYQEAKNRLDQPHTPKREGAKYRKLANNTYLIDKDDYIAVLLHETEIVKLHPDYFILDSGGYRTLTTKDRMNRFSPIHLYQENFIWYIGELVYFDDLKLDYAGNPLNERLGDIEKESKQINKRIKKFVNNAMQELEKGIPLPSGGDCWHCAMKGVNDQKTVGDAFNDHSHLESHLEENYIVPSLIFNAVEEAGYQSPILIISGWQCNDMTEKGLMGGDGSMLESVKRALRRYLQKRLLAI